VACSTSFAELWPKQNARPWRLAELGQVVSADGIVSGIKPVATYALSVCLAPQNAQTAGTSLEIRGCQPVASPATSLFLSLPPLCRLLDWTWRRLSTSATACEASSFHPVHGWTYPTSFDDDIPSNAGKVRIDFHYPQPQLKTTDCDQYYAIATTTIFFYDFLLTLGDEVSRVIGVSFATFTVLATKGQIRLAGKEVMGYVGRIACRTASVDDLTVFAIFLAVRSPLYQSLPFLKG